MFCHLVSRRLWDRTHFYPLAIVRLQGFKCSAPYLRGALWSSGQGQEMQPTTDYAIPGHVHALLLQNKQVHADTAYNTHSASSEGLIVV